MTTGKHLQPGCGPVGLASSSGFPWTRLVTGVFAVAISLSMSGRLTRAPVELPRMEAPQPNHEQPATAEVPDRRQPESLETAARRETESPPAAQAQLARPPAGRAPGSTNRHPPQRVAHAHSGLAAREQVAAFTGEDSGSAYLTRLAACAAAPLSPNSPPAAAGTARCPATPSPARGRRS